MTKFKIIIAGLLVLIGAGFYFKGDIQKFYYDILGGFEQIQKASLDSIAKIEKHISLPAPIRAVVEVPQTLLTRSGTINWTNTQREQNNLPLLRENQRLNAAAEAKARDMFAKQYFEHVSPTGRGPADLADDANYEYLAIGENLALGNFGDDEKLVEAWMNSPGHRANILSKRYSEIGVAVMKGVFEGRTTWLAVQEFGRPLADCPEPEEELKSRIEQNNAEIDAMNQLLITKREELENTKPKRGPEYNAKVDEFNALVEKYNALVVETKTIIEQFNGRATVFNQCIESFR